MTKLLLFLSVILLNLSLVSSAKEPHFCSTQILAHPIENGYTWTLASRLGEFLGMAEKEYGARDKSWTILGVEFTDKAQPRNWHPFDTERKNIIIQLTMSSADNKKEALFQLAHEVFHVLSPTGRKDGNYLEEGLATYFSIKASQKAGIDISPNYIASSKYRKAYDLIKTVYEAHPDASERITAFRSLKQPFSTIDEQQLMKLFPKIKLTLARQLAAEF